MTPVQLITTIITTTLLFSMGFVAWYTQGFLLKYAMVRASKGRKVLLKVKTKTGHYFVTGNLKDGNIEYKDRSKNTKLLTNVQDGTVYRSLGVAMADTDEETNNLFNHLSWKAVPGHDAVRTDNMIKTALMKPSLNNNQLIILLLLGLVAIIALASAYLSYQNYAMLKDIGARIAVSVSTSPVVPA